MHNAENNLSILSVQLFSMSIRNFHIFNGKPTVGDSGTHGVGRVVTQKIYDCGFAVCEIHLVQVK